MGFLSSLKPKSRSAAVISSSNGGGKADTNVPNRQSRTTVEEYSTPVEVCSTPEPNFLAPKPLILPNSRQGSFTSARSLPLKTPHSTKPRVRTPADLAGADTAAAGGSASDGDSVLGEDSAGSSRMLPNLLLSEAEVQEMMAEELSRNSSAASLGHALSIQHEGGTSSRLGTSTPIRNFANNITFHRNKSLADGGFADSPKSVSHVSFHMMPSNKSLQYSRSGKSAGSTSGSSSNAWAEYSSSSAGTPAAATAADEDMLIAAMDCCLDSLTAAVHLAKADSKPKRPLGKKEKEPLRAKQRMAAAAAEFHRSTSGGRSSSGAGSGSGSGAGGSGAGGSGASGSGASGSGGSRGISAAGVAKLSAASPVISWSGALGQLQPANSALAHQPKGLTFADTVDHSPNPGNSANGAAAAAVGGRVSFDPSSSGSGGVPFSPSESIAGNDSGGGGRHVVVSVDNKTTISSQPGQLKVPQASRDFDRQELPDLAADGVISSRSSVAGSAALSSLQQSVSPQQGGSMATTTKDDNTQQNVSTAGQATQRQQQQHGVLGSGDGAMSAARANSGSRGGTINAHTAVDIGYTVSSAGQATQQQLQQGVHGSGDGAMNAARANSGSRGGSSDAHTAVDIGYTIPTAQPPQPQQQQPQQQQDLRSRRLSWSPSKQQQAQFQNQGAAARFGSSTGSSGSGIVYSRGNTDTSIGDGRGSPAAAGAPSGFLAPQPPTSARSGSRRPSASSAAKTKAVGRVYGVV